MLFTPSILIAGGATIVLAALDKTLEDYGYHWLGTALRIALPIAAFAAGIYFIETNALIGWLR
jgi:hypothetical protein